MAIIPSYVPDGLGQGPGLAERPRYAPADGPYIMFAGALSEHKGVGVLLRAHERLWESGHEVPLVLVGVPGDVIDGGEPSQPGVIVAASAPHGEVMKGWRHAEIGVAPSLWGEPFGQVAVECLAVGTPLVASRVGGLIDIVQDDVSGLLVEPGDDSALFRTIRRLLGDPGLRRRLGAAGALRAREFMVSAVLPRIDFAYAEAIGARAARLCSTGAGSTSAAPT